LQRAVAALRAESHKLDAPAAADEAGEARLVAAVERLAAKLTTHADGDRG
jgi:hypothetical protein